MKIAVASDHGGVNLKSEILNLLGNMNIEVIDCSPVNNENDDYPVYAAEVCKQILDNKVDFGILICKSGIGMSIAANKFKGIYCAKITNVEEAKLARAHNGANVISIDGELDVEVTRNMIDAFLKTSPLDAERHIRRFNKIIKIENGEYDVL